MKTLKIFTAGVAYLAIKATADIWNMTHPDIQIEVYTGGSVNLIRDIIYGKECDILVSADDTIINKMLMPKYVKGYIVFAGNKITVSALESNDINDYNWKEKLLEPDTKFIHKNPYADPGGYRAVMALLLADQYEKGLTDKLMNHPGHIGMDKNLTRENMPVCNYSFEYYSSSMSSNRPFANLPCVMDLSDFNLSSTYKSVSFNVDENTSILGAAIAHAITIPESSKQKTEAKKFVKQFLNTNLKLFNFLELDFTVGEDILE